MKLKQNITTNLIWVLTDVLQQLMIELLDDLKKENCTVGADHMKRFKLMIKNIDNAKKATQSFSKALNCLPPDEQESFIRDCDFMAEVIKLAADRSTGMPDADVRIKALLFNLPSSGAIIE